MDVNKPLAAEVRLCMKLRSTFTEGSFVFKEEKGKTNSKLKKGNNKNVTEEWRKEVAGGGRKKHGDEEE